MSNQSIVRLVLAILLLSISPAQANDINNELTAARNVFLQGVDGDKRAVRKATKHFRALSTRYPENPVFIAYLGASMTLKGRDAQNNLDKQRLTEEGLGIIEQALSRLPEDNDEHSTEYLETLLVVADTFVYIPAFFNRYERGRHLLQEILNHRNFSSMAAGYKAAAYFTAANIARGKGMEDEYRHYLTLAENTDPQGRNGQSARQLLKQ